MIKTSTLLSAFSETITHGFFPMETPDGYCLSATYKEENLDPKIITERRNFMMQELAPSTALIPLTLHQTHSNIVKIVNEPWAHDQPPTADGLVTKTPGLVLGILTADCGPVLLADRDAGVVGACHAGWKGAERGIIESTIASMESLGANRFRIRAALGPTIQPHTYEVGPEFPLNILKPPFVYSQLFTPSTTNPLHHLFDLPRYICNLLLASGVTQIENLGLNTFDGPYFSRRRNLATGCDRIGENNFSAIAILSKI